MAPADWRALIHGAAPKSVALAVTTLYLGRAGSSDGCSLVRRGWPSGLRMPPALKLWVGLKAGDKGAGADSTPTT